MRRPRLLIVAVLALGVAHPLAAQSPAAHSVTGPAAPSCRDAACLDATPAARDSSGRPSFFGELLSPLGRDFQHVASRDGALWLGIGGVGALAVHAEDRHITATLAGSSGADEALDAGSVVGGGAIQFGAALGVYVIGRASDGREIAHVGADLFQAQVVSGAMTQALKIAVGRTRPDGGRYSFPSGHTSAAFASATVLQRHYGWKVGIPAYAIAGYVGGSRLAENRHFPSDVWFGAAVGIAAARAVTLGHGAHQFALTPVTVRGGMAVALVQVGSR
jgi:membrane-associated phospholipid phosphatase